MFEETKIAGGSPPALNQFEIKLFLGADTTNAPSNVSGNRSPFCPNMIRESKGKVRKWIGFCTAAEYPARINGVHFFTDESGTKKLVHAGTIIYLDGETREQLYTEANDVRSASRQMGGRLCLFDGKKYLLFGKFGDTYAIHTAEQEAYVPVILISRKPSGGGTTLEPINLLGAKRTEKFLGTAADKVYQLSASELSDDALKVEKLNASGAADLLVESKDFTVDRKTGKVTFTAAPGESPVLGRDNVYITYTKRTEDYADRINKCDIVTLYGVNGARDRLFAAGNPKHPNQDYYSQLGDPTYFGDLWYSNLGQDNSRIMGYSIVNDQLAAHKNKSEDETNIVLRRGILLDGKASFTLSGSYQGTGSVSKYAFSVLETEPLFATKDGIFAVTPSDVLGERYAQLRSYYINGLLLKENLEDAVALTYGQFYMIAAGEYLFALDGSQLSVDRNIPFSHRQYECYYRTGVHARVLFEENGNLLFGTAEGKIMRFYDDYTDVANFNDNGREIYAAWQTPEFYGRDFYNRKDFRKIAVLLGSAVTTGCRIWGIYDGRKELLRDYDGTGRYFSFRYLTFSKLSFKTDRTPQEIIERIKVKKVKKISFLFENGVQSEPFGLYMATAEFIESR